MDATKLVDKLVRELAQAEFDAQLHTRRQAGRLGRCLPSSALDAIAEHATGTWSGFITAAGPHRRFGIEMGRLIARILSAIRHFSVDLIIDAQRSYRATLLGLTHGLDCTRLLRAASVRSGDTSLARWCDEMLVERVPLIEDAVNAMQWFADEPEIALHPAGARRLGIGGWQLGRIELDEADAAAITSELAH